MNIRIINYLWQEKGSTLVFLVLIITSSILVVFYPLIGGIGFVSIFITTFFNYSSDQFLIKTSFNFLVVSAFLGAYLSFPGYKSIFLFRILLIVQLLILILYRNSLIRLDDGKRTNFYIEVLLLMWVLGCFITLFWAEYKIIGLRNMYYAFEASCLLSLPFYFIHTKKALKATLTITSIIYIISLGIGFYEVITGQHLKLSGSLFYETTTSQFQPTGFLFNTNDYALFLAMFLPLVFYRLYSVATHRLIRMSGLVVWFSSFYLVVTTYSRLGIVSMVLVSIVIYWVYFKRATLALLFTGSLALLLKELYSIDLFQNAIHIIQISFTQKDASTSDRLNLYNIIWTIAKKSYFAGIGAGGIPIEIAVVRQGYESSYLNFNSAHNFFLESLGEIGLFTLFLVSVIVILFYRFLVISIKKTSETILEYSPLLMLIIFLFSSVALSTIVEQRFLWLGLGLALAVCLLKEGGELEDDQTITFDNL